MAAHEAEALVDDVEDAARVGVAGSLGLALQDLVDQDVLALGGRRLELEVARDLPELCDAHLAKVADLKVVAFAGGLEFLLLFELRDGGASATSADGVAAARTTVA